MNDSRDLFRTGERPNEKDRGTGWDIVRPNHLQPDTIAIVSHTFFPTRIHHFKGSTIACRKDGCAACNAGESSRWRGYLLGIVAKSRRRVIMECSAEVEQILEDLKETYTTLRGLVVVFTRTKKRSNGKHLITFMSKLADDSVLPQDRDVWPIICRIFGIEEFVSPAAGEKTIGEQDQIKPRSDGRRQRGLKRNTASEFEQLVNSEPGTIPVSVAIDALFVNGNGRTVHK